jgi:C4-dicarboxylate transporter DctM subunit
MIIFAVISLVIFTLLGLPLFAAILGGAMLGLWSSGVDLAAIPIEIYRLANAPVLLAIPLFTLAGYLLAEGGTSARLVRFSRSLLGWVPGGLGMVALVSCAFFTAITGATGITIIALGGLLLPALVSEHYKKDFSLGLVTTSGSLGLHFPPSLPLILYGYVSGVNIEALFVAGFLPGVLMVAVPCLFSVWMGKRWKLDRPAFSLNELVSSLREAVWELPIPLLILGGIYSGLTTATEASALTAAYVLFVKTVVFKEVRLCRESWSSPPRWSAPS